MHGNAFQCQDTSLESTVEYVCTHYNTMSTLYAYSVDQRFIGLEYVGSALAATNDTDDCAWMGRHFRCTMRILYYLSFLVMMIWSILYFNGATTVSLFSFGQAIGSNNTDQSHILENITSQPALYSTMDNSTNLDKEGVGLRKPINKGLPSKSPRRKPRHQDPPQESDSKSSVRRRNINHFPADLSVEEVIGLRSMKMGDIPMCNVENRAKHDQYHSLLTSLSANWVQSVGRCDIKGPLPMTQDFEVILTGDPLEPNRAIPIGFLHVYKCESLCCPFHSILSSTMHCAISMICIQSGWDFD